MTRDIISIAPSTLSIISKYLCSPGASLLPYWLGFPAKDLISVTSGSPREWLMCAYKLCPSGSSAEFALLLLSSSFLPWCLQPSFGGPCQGCVATVCWGYYLHLASHCVPPVSLHRVCLHMPQAVPPGLSVAHGHFNEIILFFLVFFCFNLYPHRYWYKLQGRCKEAFQETSEPLHSSCPSSFHQ